MNNQHSHQVIIDVGYPTTREMFQNIVEALNTTLQLVSSTIKNNKGNYYIGISAINNNFSRIYAFRFFEGNYNLFHVLQQIESMARKANQISEQEYNDLLHIGIKTALDDFTSYFKRFSCEELSDAEIIQKNKQLSIAVITSKTTYNFKSKLNTISFENDIKNILVLKVAADENQEQGEEKEIPHQDCDPSSILVEEIKITQSQLGIHLKKHFFESSCDIGRLTLTMPDMILHCDMRAFMIDAIKENTSTNNKNFCYYNLSLFSNQQCTNEYNMEVIHKVMSDGVCESHVYGFPIKVTSAKHLRYNPNKHLDNKMAFVAICNSLIKSDEYLILKYTQFNDSQVNNYFFLLRPGEDSMLMKSLIPSELLLPEIDETECVGDNMTKELSEKANIAAMNTLSQIITLYKYNPANFKTGLPKNTALNSAQSIISVKRNLLHPFLNLPEASSSKITNTPEPKGKKMKLNFIHPALLKTNYNEEINKRVKNKRTKDAQQEESPQCQRVWFKSFNDISNTRRDILQLPTSDELFETTTIEQTCHEEEVE